jgi:pyruvate dehydrogenase E1 component beta subunit
VSSVTLAKAVHTALKDSLTEDRRVLIFGEDVGTLGGVFRVTDGLQREFGEQRVFDTPLAESTIAGIAIGLALKGFRPVAEMQFDAFCYAAFEQITSHIAKYRNRAGGRCDLPLTLRIPFGGGIGAVEHHSESPEAYFTATPGLKVVTPSNPADAYGLLRSAIADNDPVIFFEPKARYWSKEEVDLPVPPVPLGTARVARAGTDATVIAYGPSVELALKAAEAAEEEGTHLEVIDLRSLAPLDIEALLVSVRKTHRAVIVHEAPVFGGYGAEVAARLSHDAFDLLEAPVMRVGAPNAPYPPSRFEKLYLPDVDRVLEAVDQARDYA